MARTITDNKLVNTAYGGTYGESYGPFVMPYLVTSSKNFKVTAAMKEITFIGVGGGGNAIFNFSGGGAGLFLKTLTDPVPDTTYSLVIGATTGTTSLRDAGGNIICQATGGKSATSSAHGSGGTASGGDINSNGAPGNFLSGGGAGSPFGDSVDGNMLLFPEYARGYVQKVKAALIQAGYLFQSNENTKGAPFTDGGFGAAGGFGFCYTPGVPATGEANGRDGGFGCCGEMGGNKKPGGNGGFGGGGGKGGPGGSQRGGNGGNGGYGGGGGPGGDGSPRGDGGSGGSGAILVLIKATDELCVSYV